MIHKMMPMQFEYIGGPDAGKTIIQLRHYEWQRIVGNLTGYYRWDERREAYVWTPGQPEEPKESP